MNKEDYLDLINKLDIYISNEIEELEKLKVIAEKITQENNGMPHASGTSDKVGNFAVKIVMKRQEINDTIDLFFELREEIIAQIKKLRTDEYDVLYKYYVLNMSINNISEVKNKSISWVKEIKKNGIKYLKINNSHNLRIALKKILSKVTQSDPNCT